MSKTLWNGNARVLEINKEHYSFKKSFDSKKLIDSFFPDVHKDPSKHKRLSDKDSTKRLAELFNDILVQDKQNILMLHEKQYIDQDYLEDYSEHHCRSFVQLDKQCSRIHFFLDVSKKQVEDYFHGFGDNDINLQENYLGFIVLRPLVHSIYGRCFLRPPSSLQVGGTKLVQGKTVQVNIYGVAFTITAIPFLEQDLATSACGTVALWISNHCSENSFNNTCLSPSRITKKAIELLPAQNNGKFSSDLSDDQLKKAIEESGLKYIEFLIAENKQLLKGVTRAYLNLGITPILLVKIKITTTSAEEKNKIIERDLTHHAVALCGYSNFQFSQHQPTPYSTPLLSDDIKTIVIHDDQAGPYIEHPLGEDNSRLIRVFNRKINTRYENPDVYFEVSRLIVPLYHKIRLSYIQVESFIKHLHFHFFDRSLRPSDNSKWDVLLTDSKTLKLNLRESHLEIDARNSIVFSHLPRFMWTATYYVDKQEKLKIIIDATVGDIGKSILFVAGDNQETCTDFYLRANEWISYYVEYDEGLPNNADPSHTMAIQSLVEHEKYTYKPFATCGKYAVEESTADYLNTELDRDFAFTVVASINNELLEQGLCQIEEQDENIEFVLKKVGHVERKWVIVVYTENDKKEEVYWIYSIGMEDSIEHAKKHTIFKRSQ